MTKGGAKDLISTGSQGLDEILNGGLPRNRLYLLQGDPGAGKTTLGLQFLLEGARKNERCLYVSLSETMEEVQAVASSHGWSLEGIHVHEPPRLQERMEDESTLFHPAEVELTETVQNVLDVVDKVKPARLVFDSLSELRLLATNALRYRRQILALKQAFATRRCTVLLLDDLTSGSTDDSSSIAHGVIELVQDAPIYGPDRRRARIRKLRGIGYLGGFHDMKIVTGGVVIHPRLVAADHAAATAQGMLSSGITNLDSMVGGGLDRGTSALLLGAAGTGKSALAMQYMLAAVARGEHATLFNFDESLHTVYSRARALGTDLRELVSAGKLTLRSIDPAELPPGEFVSEVRRTVEQDKSKVIVIDSMNGYLNSMPEERFMLIHLHEILSYLRHRGVLTLLLLAQHGLIGTNMQSPLDVSYLADTVLMFRYYEWRGEIRKALSVVKKRSGSHESSIREFSMSSRGLAVGDPLQNFEGILTGVPRETSHDEGIPGGKSR